MPDVINLLKKLKMSCIGGNWRLNEVTKSQKELFKQRNQAALNESSLSTFSISEDYRTLYFGLSLLIFNVFKKYVSSYCSDYFVNRCFDDNCCNLH